MYSIFGLLGDAYQECCVFILYLIKLAAMQIEESQ